MMDKFTSLLRGLIILEDASMPRYQIENSLRHIQEIFDLTSEDIGKIKNSIIVILNKLPII